MLVATIFQLSHNQLTYTSHSTMASNIEYILFLVWKKEKDSYPLFQYTRGFISLAYDKEKSA